MRVNREKAVRAAQKFVEKGRLDKAVVEYQKLVKANPRDDRALLKVAELQTRMRSYDAAVSTYEQIANYYLKQGFSAKAMAIYNQIRGLIQRHLPESKGRYGPVVNKLVTLYIESGLTGDAVATYQEYARHLQRVGRDRELLPIYRKIVALAENDLDSRLQLIEMLRDQGAHDEADEHLVAYGERLIRLGRINEGLLALDNVSQRNVSDARLARRVADLFLDRNGPGDALAALTRMQVCFQSTRRDMETLRVLARALGAIGQREKSIAVRKLMVKIAHEKGDAKVAQGLVDDLVKEFPKEPSIRDVVYVVYPDLAPPESEPLQNDGPVVETGHMCVDVSDGPLDSVEDSIIELGEEAFEGVSSHPVPPPEPYTPKSTTPLLESIEPEAPSSPRQVSALHVPPPRVPLPHDSFEDEPDELIAEVYDDLLQDDGPDDGIVSLPRLDKFEKAGDEQAKPFLPESCDATLPWFSDDDDNLLGDEREVLPAAEPTSGYGVDDALDEALEEANFLASQELFEDALSTLEELIPNYSGHPLLIERMQSIRSAMQKLKN